MLSRRFAQIHITKAWFLFLWLAYVFVRLLTVQGITNPVFEGDSADYIRVSLLPFFSSDFWIASRPIGLPFFYKLFGTDVAVLAEAQCIFSIITWSIFAFTVAKCMRHTCLQVISFFMILLLSLNPEVLIWDFWVMSESLSLSLFALLCSAWLLVLQKWTLPRIIYVVCTTCAWGVVRDTNAWVLLVAAAVIFPVCIVRQKRYLWIVGAMLCTFLYTNHAADVSMRWEYSYYNIMGQWILTDTDNIYFFVSHDMPFSVELFMLAGKWGSGNNSAFYRDPALEEFRVWVHEHGKDTYKNYLIYNWSKTIGHTLSSIKSPMAFENFRPKFYPEGYQNILPNTLSFVSYFRLPALRIVGNAFYGFYIVFGVSVTLYFIIRGSPKHGAMVALPVFLFIFILPHAFFIKNGDPGGIYRHAIQVSVHIRMALWLLILFVCDIINIGNLGLVKRLALYRSFERQGIDK